VKDLAKTLAEKKIMVTKTFRCDWDVWLWEKLKRLFKRKE